ncbi:flavin reductase family protein [Nocardia mexicana]|uniref:Flavin reductase (DIM6/NTAB) family NADH-FMN oxidoreductase RutF n=1 Tax=Nocardia mexicana TaxID=279262 RepID=A0A370H4A8_9NOCA|nr:flavin reductase family protein [Nocardia mexicana]RDI50618.1 flavin reductase (DIM6/NTAB) family NADH-FMN oxidoreductase RutF [Nocardia mexicana]
MRTPVETRGAAPASDPGPDVSGGQIAEPAVDWTEPRPAIEDVTVPGSVWGWTEPAGRGHSPASTRRGRLLSPRAAPTSASADVDLRAVMRSFATGVAIAGTYVDRPGGRRHDAVTVNSVSSLSLEPPLVSIALRTGSGFGRAIRASRVWSLSILDGGSQSLASLFARDRTVRDGALTAQRTRPGGRTGALLFDSPAWLECVLDRTYDVGDHVLFIGEVVAAGARDPDTGLVFLHGAFHSLPHSPDHRSGGTP